LTTKYARRNNFIKKPRKNTALPAVFFYPAARPRTFIPFPDKNCVNLALGSEVSDRSWNGLARRIPAFAIRNSNKVIDGKRL
jgi:hypothetical protein